MSQNTMLILLLLSLMGGCASEPSGPSREATIQLDFLLDGQTTKNAVLNCLLSPSDSFKNGKIFTYRLNKNRDKYIVLSQYDMGYQTPGIKDNGWFGQYSLVLVFDDNDVLQRHSLVLVTSPKED